MKCDVRMCRVAISKITNFGIQNREFGEFKIKLHSGLKILPYRSDASFSKLQVLFAT